MPFQCFHPFFARRDFSFPFPPEARKRDAHMLRSENIKSLNRYIIITICYIFSLHFIESSYLLRYIMDIWFSLNVFASPWYPRSVCVNKTRSGSTIVLWRVERLWAWGWKMRAKKKSLRERIASSKKCKPSSHEMKLKRLSLNNVSPGKTEKNLDVKVLRSDASQFLSFKGNLFWSRNNFQHS